MANGWDDDTPQHPAPYAASYGGYAGLNEPAKLPVFVTVVVIIDLVFCVIRLLMVPLSIFGMTVIDPSDPIYATAIFEVLTGLGIAVFGIAGHVLILFRKPLGIPLVALAILSTLGSMGVGYWQLPMMITDFPEGSPERAGAYIGAGIATVIRLALCILVGMALVKFKAWSDEQVY